MLQAYTLPLPPSLSRSLERPLAAAMPVPAALIAEKPSYSRGPDGKTPYGVASFQQQIVDLHKSTLSSSMMASAAKSAFAAAKDYYAADASHRQIAVVRQDERAYRLAQEKERQAEERQNLAKAFKIEKGRFEAEWAARIEAVEADCVERERVLREVHEIARADCEKGIERKVASLRHRSSSYLLSMEDTQEKLARMATDLTAARLLVYRAVWEKDRGPSRITTEAAMAKAFVCKAAEWVTREALQIHGGYGYAEEYEISRLYVDARVLSIFEGADETLCLKLIARRLLS